jgi:hypothetical protein
VIPPLNEKQRIEYERELTILRKSLSKHQQLLPESAETEETNENIEDFNAENISLATRSMKIKYPSEDRYRNYVHMNRLPSSLSGKTIQDVFYYKIKYPYAWVYDDIPIGWRKKIIDKNMKNVKNVKKDYKYLPIPGEIVLFQPVMQSDIKVGDIISTQDVGKDLDLYLFPRVIEAETIMVIKYPTGTMFTLPVGRNETKYYNRGIMLSDSIFTYIVREVFMDNICKYGPYKRIVFADIHENVSSEEKDPHSRSEENVDEILNVDETLLTYQTRIIYNGGIYSVIEILNHYNKESGSNSPELQFESITLDLTSMIKFQGVVQPFIELLGSVHTKNENPWNSYQDIVYGNEVIEVDVNDLVLFIGKNTTIGDIMTEEYREAKRLAGRPNVDVENYKYHFSPIYIEDDSLVDLYGIKTTFGGLIQIAYDM